MASLDPKAWINLGKAKILALDDHREGANILSEMCRGFGVRDFYHARSYVEAQQHILENEVHLVVINVNLRHADPFEFVHWLRRTDIQPNAYAPVILVAGHTLQSNVERARDCGANVVMAKPATAKAVLGRIMWTAREKRMYVQSADYVGPDRRFREVSPPGSPLRRYNDSSDDAQSAAGAAGSAANGAAA
jgi:CheY-like chemotaxis protein